VIDPHTAFYTPLGGGRYAPSDHVQGAWRQDEQHLAPVCGLIVHCLHRHEPRPDLQLARITFDALGVIGLADCDVEVRTIRPGRTIQQLEATLSVGGRAAVRATAWLLARQDTSEVAGGQDEQLPAPDSMPVWSPDGIWESGFLRSVEIRGHASTEPGRGQAWIRPLRDLVEGEPASAIAAFLGVVDVANGVATRVHPGRWFFPNVDLTVHLFREPEGGWVGLDTRVVFGDTGLGLTSTTLHDTSGPVGRAEQALTLRPA
jgi:Thioesterase-like superfamily